MSYPDSILREISNRENFIDEDGYPTAFLFHFVKREEQEERKDGFLAESINWRDDDDAVVSLFRQTKKDGSLQFKAGAAVLSRSDIDRLIKRPTVEVHRLSYERKPLPENKYHGNLLLGCQVPPRIMKRIAATIATDCVIEVIPNSYYETASHESS
jgi:hypothetical protein